MRIFTVTLVLLAIAWSFVPASAQDKRTGGIKGKVRVESGSPADVAVIARQGNREVAKVSTNGKGEFNISGLQPGRYGLTFRKPGLSVGTIEDVEVNAGKTRSLSNRLILPVDPGSLAFIRGSVFTSEGYSLSGAQVEIARVGADGKLTRVDNRVTTETGQFAFRLPPSPSRYRVTAKASGWETSSQEVEIDDAAVYRLALTLQRIQR